MDSINFEELMKTAAKAYAVLKQSGLSEPLKDGALKFTNWFSSLFTRKIHKEKVALMEQLLADAESLKMLQLELEAQAEENENLKKEISQKQKEYSKLRNNPEFEAIFTNVNSSPITVVGSQFSTKNGSITIGHTINESKR